MNTINFKLGDIARVISGYAFKSEDFKEGGSAPVIKIKNIKIGNASIDEADYVNADFFKKLDRKFHVFPGEILISLTGSHITQPNSVVGRVGRYPFDYPAALLNQRAGKVIPDESVVDSSYLFYVLMDEDLRKEIAQMASGSASQANISPRQVESVTVPLPDIEYQKKVGETLLGYDNLIENNNRRIAILEEMAKSLYREWFEKFRYPGHENQKLVESPLGLIPEGWEVKRLDDFLVLQRGFDLPKQNRDCTGNVPIYAASGFTGFHNEVKTKGPGIVTGRSGTLGIVTLILEDFWPLNTSLWIKEFRNCTAFYAYYLLMGLNLERFNSGSSVPTLNRNDVHGQEVIAPPLELVRRFEVFSEACHRSVKNVRKKNENLKSQRDMLLPKLISGAILL